MQSITCKGEEHREGEEHMEEGGDILVSAEHCMGRSLGKGEEHREGADWLVQSIAWGGA